ncbi:MAG: bifunctional glycosyltransferase family 2/GtrA family protein [Oscillospiraceae bacterium]|nr:bifunctional glycosyltransferase family 2/GtrA family protein [Oscillospiraceae bacterium]MBQ2057782.1 bifunctional glycosyltransferase family 2/GtrA family protein [Oscillospiraceae bacterium]MBQ3951130.1 bifunctional glycosyltransferase family 2/GtrA family protein [Oscillospiraceae bacterium]MBQ5515057.1 bifunctional glycosyltransferase family 2/GtrA family protein [Oscillospiraceae bacterium]
MSETICLIPAYEPDEKLLKLVREGLSAGAGPFLIVDDGSSESCGEVFSELEAMGVTVLRHEKNMGKGAALKTGIGYVAENLPLVTGIVTADADGQHKVSDIIRVRDEMDARPSELILGVRSFTGDGVPRRSRTGNRLTTFVFRLMTGIRLSDTQTGLRGIPRMYFETALKVEGGRYEYEMNFLLDMAAANVHFTEVPIETVYIENNKSSHFRVIRDSFLIYRRPLTFALSSLSCSLIDIVAFALFSGVLFSGRDSMIIPATVMARVLSGLTNFILNKLVTFRARGHSLIQTVKYLALFVTVMLLSGAFVSLLSFLPAPRWLIKIPVDLCLFFVNYVGQKKWVFKN